MKQYSLLIGVECRYLVKRRHGEDRELGDTADLRLPDLTPQGQARELQSVTISILRRDGISNQPDILPGREADYPAKA